ncbi:8-amino-7-oxononanoate synthase [delta proteobacterium NaphS2]|nr:8-amino-7-oxononanoate synthase [delta proteobacterium NaphS2]
MTQSKFAFIDQTLAERERSGRLRALKGLSPLPGARVRVKGRVLDNFSSNDYLGLSMHPLLRERAIEYTERYGAGAAASRLICGTMDCCLALESKLADLKGTEAALIFNSGYQANVSLLPALADRRSLILSDRLNHNSLIKGAMLSRCRVIPFRHNDTDHLKKLLEENMDKGYSRLIVVTESVFSMDGDCADLGALSELAQDFGAWLMVDEAHAMGVMGKRGMGLACGKKVDLAMGTFGKAGGSFGAYAACSRKVRDYLVNCCSGFIYSTGLPPAVLGTIDAALDLIPGLDEERTLLQFRADRLRATLNAGGFNTGDSVTQIIPVILGDEGGTVSLSKKLEENGILATAIRPPTVPSGGSRIRLSLSAAHTRDQLERLTDAFFGAKDTK